MSNTLDLHELDKMRASALEFDGIEYLEMHEVEHWGKMSSAFSYFAAMAYIHWPEIRARILTTPEDER